MTAVKKIPGDEQAMKQHLEILNDMVTLRRDESNRCITAHSAVHAISDTAKTLTSLYATTMVVRTHLSVNAVPID